MFKPPATTVPEDQIPSDLSLLTPYVRGNPKKVTGILDFPALAYALASMPHTEAETLKVLTEHGITPTEFASILQSPVFKAHLADAQKTMSDKADPYAAANKAAAVALLPNVLDRALAPETELKDKLKAFEMFTSNAGMSKKQGTPMVNVSVINANNLHTGLAKLVPHLIVEEDNG